MDRKMFVPTEKMSERWANYNPRPIQSDEEFKARAKKERKPWGILKRNAILSAMSNAPEYQRGIWQGRVDKARGLDYSEERNENTYNLGYYRGYTDYIPGSQNGWDSNTHQWFVSTYVEA